MSWMTFMKEVIRENKTTGAFAPSSRELADAITRYGKPTAAGG